MVEVAVPEHAAAVALQERDPRLDTWREQLGGRIPASPLPEKTGDEIGGTAKDLGAGTEGDDAGDVEHASDPTLLRVTDFGDVTTPETDLALQLFL